MKYRMPNYYNEFCCIADKCPDTCCGGWDIVIDDASMKKYNAFPKALKKYVMTKINKEEHIFKRCDGRCAFLNVSNLCDLYKKAGKDSLCKTCSRYPRHFEEYGELVEAALSMSCPVAAGLIIDRMEKDCFLVRETDKKSPHEKEVDKKLLETLAFARKVIFEAVNNRSYSIGQRINFIMDFGSELQPILYDYERLGVKKYIKSYVNKNIEALNKKINQYKCRLEEKAFCFTEKSKYENIKPQSILKDFFLVISGLEKINDEWGNLVNYVINMLYIDLSKEEYTKLSNEFSEYMRDRQYEYEHILNYFIYTYFLGGVYDYNIHGMIKMSVISTIIIRELGMAKWLENEKKLSVEEQIKVAYTYSRQIEHSDNNLICLEGLMTAHPVFSDEKIISIAALCCPKVS